MVPDIRLYYYDGAGQLKKPGTGKGVHLFTSEVDAINYVGLKRTRGDQHQWVIVEYTYLYRSKIINILNP